MNGEHLPFALLASVPIAIGMTKRMGPFRMLATVAMYGSVAGIFTKLLLARMWEDRRYMWHRAWQKYDRQG